jgi:hypothetical protein
MTRTGEEYSVASVHPDVLEIMKARFAHAAAEFDSLRIGPSPLEAQRERNEGRERHVPEQWRAD